MTDMHLFFHTSNVDKVNQVCASNSAVLNNCWTFSECSCIADSDENNEYYAKEGFCVSEDCWSQTLGYVITLPILQFITSLLRIQYTIVLLRSISPEDKSVALGTFEALVCIFGFVPYMIIIGALVDSTCLVWEKSCGETGNCWFYEMDQFNNILHALSAGFTGLSAVTLMATYFLSHHIRDLYEEDEDIEGTVVNHKEVEATKADLEMNSLTKL
ncbi:solute carrier organic anion transporter family member [Caerostris extrusa]|uniref:Solute carrier organic anion transporter family member n=1 Tax=Caerostris extrusa TaxID=172846 RepID=A0AAV4QVP0_CAEEX|nr:solute carrier organic anion transporter family member [Caerostris extrusa]